MQAFDNDTLTLTPLENPGWDPVCFLTPEGFRYFAPGLIRVQIEALKPDPAIFMRYLDIVGFHLRDPHHKQFSLFASEEIRLVADLYRELLLCPGFEGYLWNLGDEETRKTATAWFDRSERWV